MRTAIALLALVLALPALGYTINGSADIRGHLTADGKVDVGTVETFADLDATPDVSTGMYWNTFTNTLTITDFDGTPDDGNLLVVNSKAAITYNCAGVNLTCGTTDIVTASGDTTFWLYNGATWDLVAYKDESTDMGTDAGAGGASSWDVTDTDASPILTVNDTEQVQFIGGTGITVTAAADGSNHDVTIDGHTIFSPSDLDTDYSLTATNGNVIFAAGSVWTSDATPAIDCTDCTSVPMTFTDIDTDYGAETVTSAWNFVPVGTGAFGVYDLEVGDTTTPDYGGLQLGGTGLYSSSFANVNMDLDGAFVIRQEINLGIGNDPGIEVAIMEQGNTLRFAIPESAVGNATAFIRSGTFAGPYTATIGNDAVTCNQWSTYDSNIDCDTSGTGADLFVQDDLEVEGTFFAHETINFEGSTADGNHVILQVGADPGADVTISLPTTTGTLIHTEANDLDAAVAGTLPLANLTDDDATADLCLVSGGAGGDANYKACPAGSETNTLTTTTTGIASGEIPIGTTAGGLVAYVTLQPCASNEKLEYTDGAPDTMTCEQISGLTEADIGDITLGTGTAGDFVGGVADGTGIDGTATGEDSTYTPTLDLTEISSVTWGTTNFTTMTFDPAGGANDPLFTFADDSIVITNAATFTVDGVGLTADDLSDDNPTALQNVSTINDGDYCQGNASSGFECDVTTIPAADIDTAIARLASPALTGDPTAPTATQGDSDTTIATTDFVDRRFQQECKTIESLVATDDDILMWVPRVNSTIEAVACQSSAAATVVLEDYGGTAIETIICETDGAIAWDSTISGTATLVAGEVMRMDTTSESTPTWTMVCFAWSND